MTKTAFTFLPILEEFKEQYSRLLNLLPMHRIAPTKITSIEKLKNTIKLQVKWSKILYLLMWMDTLA
jgi:hypothetical protein